MTIDPIVVTTAMALDAIRDESIGTWGAAIHHAYGQWQLDARDIELLDRYAITQDGVMHDATAEAIRTLHPGNPA